MGVPIVRLQNSPNYVFPPRCLTNRAMAQSYPTRNDAWAGTKKVLPIGTRIQCRVKEHHPFGVLAAIEGIVFDGLIEIVSFRDTPLAAIHAPGTSRIEYPPVGNEVEAIVLGYRENEPRQIGLGLRPSQLARSLKADGSYTLRRILPVGVRLIAGKGIEFFGIQEVDKSLTCGDTVAAVQEGNAIMTESSEEEKTVRLHLSDFSINIVVDSTVSPGKSVKGEISGCPPPPNVNNRASGEENTAE